MPWADQSDIETFAGFWQDSSLDETDKAAFGMRVLTYEPSAPAPATLATAGGGQQLPAVRDRTQRLLAARRSGRRFGDTPLSEKDLSRVLAANGCDGDGRRLVPSAGGLAAVHTYAIGMRQQGVLDGRIGRYDAKKHAVHDIGPAPDVTTLRRLFQLECTGTPQLMLVFVVEPSEMLRKYGARGARFALQEVGHAAQNVGLRAAADDLVAYLVGGGLDSEVLELLGIAHTPALLGSAMAVGR